MANPVLVDCNANEWTKVATNVTAGQVHKMTTRPHLYLQTYRTSGGCAPTGESKGVSIFTNGKTSELISATSGIDVYIYAKENDGKVRVDLP